MVEIALSFLLAPVFIWFCLLINQSPDFLPQSPDFRCFKVKRSVSVTAVLNYQCPSQEELNREQKIEEKKVEGGMGQGPRSHTSYLGEGVYRGTGPSK